MKRGPADVDAAPIERFGADVDGPDLVAAANDQSDWTPHPWALSEPDFPFDWQCFVVDPDFALSLNLTKAILTDHIPDLLVPICPFRFTLGDSDVPRVPAVEAPELRDDFFVSRGGQAFRDQYSERVGPPQAVANDRKG